MTCLETYFKVMNAPFKPPVISDVHGQATVSISDLKMNPSAVVTEAVDRPVAILNRNRAVAYIISPAFYEAAHDAFEELADIELVQERLANPVGTVEVSIDDLV